jgi:hypothetical protein
MGENDEKLDSGYSGVYHGGLPYTAVDRLICMGFI